MANDRIRWSAAAARAERILSEAPKGHITEHWILRRDGKRILVGTEYQCADYVHNYHSFSFSHALKYEGFSMEKVRAR